MWFQGDTLNVVQQEGVCAGLPRGSGLEFAGFGGSMAASSIISGLPEHIAVRQLASQPEGIAQNEANVAFLFQKVE